MPGLLHQAHQNDICKRRREMTGTGKPRPSKKCKNCGKVRVLTNQGLCHECLYIDSHF